MATAFSAHSGRATTNNDGPGGQLPPEPGFVSRFTLMIIALMCVDELHWIGWWVLVTLSGNS